MDDYGDTMMRVDGKAAKTPVVLERTHQFDKNKPIDCADWVEFTIVGETIRYYQIKYKSKVDKQ